jgi:hypothetical protein
MTLKSSKTDETRRHPAENQILYLQNKILADNRYTNFLGAYDGVSNKNTSLNPVVVDMWQITGNFRTIF